MKKLLLVISLIAWCGIQHFDLIRNSYQRIMVQPGNDLFNFERSAFHELPKLDMLEGKTFFMKRIKVERITMPIKPERHEPKRHGIRISDAPGESSMDGVMYMLKS